MQNMIHSCITDVFCLEGKTVTTLFLILLHIMCVPELVIVVYTYCSWRSFFPQLCLSGHITVLPLLINLPKSFHSKNISLMLLRWDCTWRQNLVFSDLSLNRSTEVFPVESPTSRSYN